MNPAARVGLVAALAFAGAGAVVVSAGLDGEPVASVPEPAAPVDGGARDPANIEANNSPTLVRNPKRPDELVVVNRVDSPRYACAVNVSRDGGKRWSPVQLAIPPGEEDKCFAPDAAFAADGTLHISYVTLRGTGNVPNAVWVVRSADGGQTLSRPRRVLGRLAFGVRLAADPRRPERIYLTWTQASEVGLYRFVAGDNPISAMRSDDGGVSWSPRSRVSDAARERVLAPTPAVATDGSVYVLYLDLGDDRLDYEGAHEGFGGPAFTGRFTLVMGRSRDGGATWEESVVDRSILPTRRFIAFLPPTPSVAIDDSSGRIHAAFEDARLGSPDVFVWTLEPGSAAWSRPVRVNDTPRADGTSQYLPRIAAAPGGRLDVAYYDRRDDARDRQTAVSLQSSWDGGRSFSRRVDLSGAAFDSRVGAGGERGLPDLGSRLGLVAAEDAAMVVWSDTRGGTEASNKQDIAFVRATFSDPLRLGESARSALRYGGFALMAVALALLLSALRQSYVTRSPTES